MCFKGIILFLVCLFYIVVVGTIMCSCITSGVDGAGYHYPLTIYGVWPVLLTEPLCGNHNQFNLLYFPHSLVSIFLFLLAVLYCFLGFRHKQQEL